MCHGPSVGSNTDTGITMLRYGYTCNCVKLAKANLSSRENVSKKKKVVAKSCAR